MSQSDASAPFISAKANLRDTIKWLITALAALATAILAGSPLTGIGTLSGDRLLIAVCGAAFGLIFILIAIALALSLLVTKTFSLNEIAKDKHLREFINGNAEFVLPPQIANIDDLIKQYADAVKILRAGANDPALREHKTYKSAAAFYSSVDAVLGRILNLAHFEQQRRAVTRATVPLFALAIAAAIGLGFFAWAASPPKSEASSTPSGRVLATMEIYPGTDWIEMARAWNGLCGGAPSITATLRGEPVPGWLDAELLSPPKCKGIKLMMPANLRATPAK